MGSATADQQIRKNTSAPRCGRTSPQTVEGCRRAPTEYLAHRARRTAMRSLKPAHGGSRYGTGCTLSPAGPQQTTARKLPHASTSGGPHPRFLTGSIRRDMALGPAGVSVLAPGIGAARLATAAHAAAAPRWTQGTKPPSIRQLGPSEAAKVSRTVGSVGLTDRAGTDKPGVALRSHMFATSPQIGAALISVHSGDVGGWVNPRPVKPITDF